MSKELKNIADNVMNQIRQDKLKMRPKIYFIAGSIFTFVGMVASIATSIFAIGLIKFFLRSNGAIFSHKLDRLISTFPWWILALAILGLVAGIILIRKYDFSYKINIKMAIALIVLTVLASGWLVDIMGFNDLLFRKGLMHGIMRNNSQEQNWQLK